MKVVEKGLRIDNRVFERLNRVPATNPEASEQPATTLVDAETLYGLAGALVQSNPLAALLASSLSSPQPLIDAVARVPLPAAIASRLTLVRDSDPALFEHSIVVALVAVYLGVKCGVQPRERESLAAAGLLHDIGMLHVDPASLAPDHRMTPDERRALFTHPITAMLLMREQQVYSPAVLAAVLEHHERLDGSGYPRGLQAAELSRFARIMSVAEVAVGVCDKYAKSSPFARLSMILRLGRNKYDPALAGHLIDRLSAHCAPAHASDKPPRESFERLSNALSLWEQLKSGMHEPQGAGARDAVAFINARLAVLERQLGDAGVHPSQHQALLDEMAAAGDFGAEVELVLQEAFFELRNIGHACLRLWSSSDPEFDEDRRVATAWCDWIEKNIF